MYKREVSIVRVKPKPTDEGWEATFTARDNDTELKFTAAGKGDMPAWAREDKQLKLTIEVDRVSSDLIE